jgi:heat shock protein HtpX
MWEQIASNQTRSAVVVASVGALLVTTGLALGAVFAGSGEGAMGGAVVALLLWLILWMVSASSGDKILLALHGAQEVRKGDHPILVNVVEEMAIAAVLPKCPRVFVVDDPSPNAFATGTSPDNAAVTVTTGLLRILNRDELQGVVAHEIGHVKNRDVKLMATAGIMVGAIVILAEMGRRAMWYGGFRRSRSSSKDDGGQAILMIVAPLMLILAPIFAEFLYLALSRRREYLADASGALFTRYPEGLASALEKLEAGTSTPFAHASAATAPMYIAAPRAMSASGEAGSLFSTHPPIRERVHILRSMGGRADVAAYEAAYRGVKGESAVGAQTLAASRPVAVREASAGAGSTAEVDRHRAASNALLSASGYGTVTCACGATLKIPPSLAGRLTECLRCGRRLPELPS